MPQFKTYDPPHDRMCFYCGESIKVAHRGLLSNNEGNPLPWKMQVFNDGVFLVDANDKLVDIRKVGDWICEILNSSYYQLGE